MSQLQTWGLPFRTLACATVKLVRAKNWYTLSGRSTKLCTGCLLVLYHSLKVSCHFKKLNSNICLISMYQRLPPAKQRGHQGNGGNICKTHIPDKFININTRIIKTSHNSKQQLNWLKMCKELTRHFFPEDVQMVSPYLEWLNTH